MNVQSLLETRAKKYGSFSGNACFVQSIKEQMRARPNWYNLSDPQKEALDMIVAKVSRILNLGADPSYSDNWEDIAGYATLVVQHLQNKQLRKEKENGQ